MRLILGTLAALGVAIAAPAAAQSVGMQIVDTTGALVGTVTAIQGDNLQVKTDKHEALLPKASFTLNNGKLLFGLTQAQLDSKIEDAANVFQRADRQDIARGAASMSEISAPICSTRAHDTTSGSSVRKIT